MELSPLVVQWREEALREGMQSEWAERRATIENLLRVRFGSLDDQLEAIIEPVLSCHQRSLPCCCNYLVRNYWFWFKPTVWQMNEAGVLRTVDVDKRNWSAYLKGWSKGQVRLRRF